MTDTTRPSNAVGIVALPGLADALSAAGVRVVTDGKIQNALKIVNKAIHEEQIPVLVSNVGQTALLRTWTRTAVRLNQGSPVAVVVLDGGYTDVRDGAVSILTPCSLNDLLTAIDLSPIPSLEGLVLGADGEVVEAHADGVIPHDTTGDIRADSFASDATEFASESVSEPVSVPTAAEYIEAPAVPSVPEVPAVPEVPEDVVVTDVPSGEEETPQEVEQVAYPAPAAPSVPDVPVTDVVEREPVVDVPAVPAVPDIEVPAVPSVDVAPVVEEVAEPTVLTHPSGRVVPDSVLRQAASKPNEWIMEYDESGDMTPDAIVGAWYCTPLGVIDPTQFTPNPRYVPFEQRHVEVPEAPEAPVAETVVAPPAPVVPAVPEPVISSEMQDEIDHDIATSTPTQFVDAPADEQFEWDEDMSDYPAPAAPVVPPAPTPVVEPAPAPVIPEAIPAPVVPEAAPAAPAYEPTSLSMSDNPISMARADSYLDIRKRPHGNGDVAIVFGAKGGVGKTTTALNLAQRAAASGLRVVLIDGNFGQGDIRQYLRLGTANIPSVYDAAISRQLRDAYVKPDTINQYRPDGLDDIKFVYVAAPPENLADPSIVTPELYAAIIAEATHFADLIVLDTQIIESVDTTGMVDRLIMPLLQENAWGVGVSDLSAPGLANLFKRLNNFTKEGVPSTRIMTLLNRVMPGSEFQQEQLATTLSRNSMFLGTVFHDEEILSNMNLGRTAAEIPALYPMLDTILATITGQQPPRVDLSSPAPQTKKKRGLFGRKSR